MSRKWECTNVFRLSTSGVRLLSFVKPYFFMFLRKYPIYVCMKISHVNLSWLLLPRRSGTCIDFQVSSANVHFCREWMLVSRVKKFSWRPNPRSGAAAGRTPIWASWCARACCGDTHSDSSPGCSWDWTEETTQGWGGETTSEKDFSVRRSKNRRVFTSYVVMRLYTFLILRYSCTIWLRTVWKKEKTEQNQKKVKHS